MCGICGFYGKGSLPDLQSMTDAMVHRGPDEEGVWHDPDCALYLGHRRLSILDIEGGTQPMWTRDLSLGVIFNGEIYNHVELRALLEQKGHVFATSHSDTEVLLHGYREWGAQLPEKLNGMWAFAIYDKIRSVLFISRDRFGKKPLYYALHNGTFAFASELTALTKHPSIRTNLSKRSLKKYFAYGYIPAPNSLYHSIYKLPGGYNLILDMKSFSFQTRKYWDFILEPFESIPKNPEEEWGEQLRELLAKAVQRRMIADVPLGIFLSGGIDSSTITALASKAVGSEKIQTFCIGFHEASFDEAEFAQRVAEHFHTNHRQQLFSIDKTRDLIPAIISKLDEPMGDSSLLPTYLLCREARKHVTVALGGDGGDELFAGYDPFRALKFAEIYKKMIPLPVHRAIRIAVSFLPVSHRNISLDFKIKRTLKGLSFPANLWNSIWMGPVDPVELEELFSEPTDIEDVYSEAIEYWDGCSQSNLIEKTLQFYTKIYLQDDILVKTDRASMMNSLEVRAPFLDIDLIDFIRKIPFQYKYRNGITKYLLKQAVQPVLPADIINRPKKGFGIPIGSWFQKKLLKMGNNIPMSYLNKDYIRKTKQEHELGTADHRLFLWNILMLSSMVQDTDYQ